MRNSYSRYLKFKGLNLDITDDFGGLLEHVKMEATLKH